MTGKYGEVWWRWKRLILGGGFNLYGKEGPKRGIGSRQRAEPESTFVEMSYRWLEFIGELEAFVEEQWTSREGKRAVLKKLRILLTREARRIDNMRRRSEEETEEGGNDEENEVITPTAMWGTGGEISQEARKGWGGRLKGRPSTIEIEDEDGHGNKPNMEMIYKGPFIYHLIQG